jgi:hypothetical protein
VTSGEVEVPCKEADMPVKRTYYVTMYLEGLRKTKKVLRQVRFLTPDLMSVKQESKHILRVSVVSSGRLETM